MHTLTIALLPGDGIGPEVVAEGVRVLRAVAERWEHAIELREGLIGGCALDARGTPLPAETVELCKSADAVLLGAVGGPRWDNPDARLRPEQGLLGLRKELQVYANLRPVTVHPSLAAASPLRAERLEGVDLVFVRELTEAPFRGSFSGRVVEAPRATGPGSARQVARREGRALEGLPAQSVSRILGYGAGRGKARRPARPGPRTICPRARCAARLRRFRR
jgi:isocitrate/isopropylmalate dehydrogenase